MHEARGAPFARTAAQHGIPLTSGAAGIPDQPGGGWSTICSITPTRVGAPMELVYRAMRNLFWYMDSMVGIGSRTYVEERRRINSRPERAKYVRIKAVLDGAGELGMPYPVDGPHVAIVLRAPQPTATLAAVAAAAGDAPLLVTEAPDGKIWAWVACDQCEQEVVAALREHGRGAVAAGVSGHEAGLAGFRAVNRKAQLALRLGSCHGNAVTTFADIALEALAVGGEDLAREFVAGRDGGSGGTRPAHGDRPGDGLRVLCVPRGGGRGPRSGRLRTNGHLPPASRRRSARPTAQQPARRARDSAKAAPAAGRGTRPGAVGGMKRLSG